MYKKLLLLFLFIFFAPHLASYAADNASATFTATLNAFYKVTKAHDGIGTIDDSGNLTTTTAQDFEVSTNNKTGCSAYMTTAQVAATPTMAQVGGTVYVALTTTGATALAITDALASSSTETSKPDVIAYTITVTPASMSAFTWNSGSSRLQGQVMTANGKKIVTTAIGATAKTNTFGTSDSAGDYVATMTLTAVGSL